MQESTELSISPPSLADHYSGVPPRKEMTIQDLWGVLSRRRRIFFSALLLTILIAAILCATTTRLYKASAEVQVQKETADALSLDNMIGTSDSASDALESNITLQTEAQILQSGSLALSVIRTLNLEKTPDFQPRFNPIGWVLGLFSPAGPSDPKGASLEDAPGRQNHVVKVFESHLKITPVSGTRLIDIEYLSSDPRTAAAVVNLLVRNLIDYNFETRHAATQQATGWLTNQLSELRKQSEDLQAKVVKMQGDSGVFTLGQTDSQGREEVYTPVLDRLQHSTSQLAEAQSARIMKGALYEVVKDGDPELISGLAGNSTLSGASSGITGSLTLLQSLRAQETQTQAQLNELSAKFGPGYPKLAEIQANLKSTQKSILAEATRIAARVKNDYTVSQQVENGDRAVFLEEKNKAEALNDKAIEYEITRQEAMQSRNLYESLVRRLKEADLIAGLHSSNITLVDRARVPSRPAKPNVLIYAAGSIFGGLIFGICAALFRDATDSRIHDLNNLALHFDTAPIGFLPHHNAKSGRTLLSDYKKPASENGFSLAPSSDTIRAESMVASTAPRAPYTEALRALRTWLMQSSHGGPPPKVILITSSVSGEGKSMLSINLAIVYAQRGKNVLLVDGDLRTPVLHHRLNLGLSTTEGLSSLLAGEDLEDVVLPVTVPLGGTSRLDVLPAGPVPHYPAELLASDEMAELVHMWRKSYDYIIIDGAPLLPVTDSVLLSRYADFTLVVARHNKTDRRSLERTCQILQSQGVRKTGVVLNGIKASGETQYSYYGYKPYPSMGVS